MANELTQYGAYSGAGQNDLAVVPPVIPYLTLLQNLSPQCQEGDPKQVQGARPGMFYNLQTGELFASTTLVLAAVKASYDEWKPRKDGGGLVAKHEPGSPVVAEARAEAKLTKTPWAMVTDAGNDLVETYTVYVVTTKEGQPTGIGVLSIKKTAIKRFQAAISRISGFRGAKDAPIFAHHLILSSTRDMNSAKQPYFNIKFDPANGDPMTSLLPGDSPILEVAAQLRESVLSGRSSADSGAEAATDAAATSETTDVVF